MIDYEYRGGHYRLYFNGLALYGCYSKFGDEKNLLEIIEPPTKEAFEALIWMLCEFSRQGELYARFLGDEPGQMLNYARMLSAVQPNEVLTIKAKVIECINEGFKRDHPGKLDKDPWLAEIEVQNTKKKQHLRLSIFKWLQKHWGFLLKRE